MSSYLLLDGDVQGHRLTWFRATLMDAFTLANALKSALHYVLVMSLMSAFDIFTLYSTFQ
jgi:hypothetical protein